MIDKSSVLVVIPARMGGYRFPDKPLRPLLGKSMVQWVWEHAKQSRYADKVVVATPDDAIVSAVTAFGGEAMLTRRDHRRGTERVCEAYRNLGAKWNIVVNFQGDEPLVTGPVLDLAIEVLSRNPQVGCVNLYKWMSYQEAALDQNEVKAVVDVNGDALYFSRNALPAIWLGDKVFQCRIEVCVMPMWAWALERFAKLPNATYEEIESVDMMRFVENGVKVRLAECPVPVKSVDCEQDLLEAEALLRDLH